MKKVILMLSLFFCFSLRATELAVPYFHQEQEYTCELAALRMVLAYYKINITEKELIDTIPKDLTAKNNNIWGDPDLGFVGDLYGKTADVSYGIHWVPLSRFAQKWKKTKIIKNGNPAIIKSHLKNKHPIIVWIAPANAPILSWQTTSGKKIKTFLGEHAVVITGIAKNKIKINDPMHGIKEENINDFLVKWKKFNYSGIVLY
jgi:uncharacterized protein YvpB